MVQTDGKPATYLGSSMSIHDIDVSNSAKITFSKIRNPETVDHYFRFAWFNSADILISRKAPLQDVFTEDVPSGAVKLRVSYPSKDKIKLEKGNKATDWSPAPEDLTGGQSSGYFIATKSSNDFDFNDFALYNLKEEYKWDY